MPRTLAEIDPSFRRAIRRLVAGEEPWPFVLIGPQGVGKTCAALCLLDYSRGLYYTAATLCEQLVAAQQGRLEWFAQGCGGKTWPEDIWKSLRREPLVVLDELGGTQRVTDHRYEVPKRLLDERYGKPLVVISNLDLAALTELYDARIASRLAGGTILRLEGRDRRVQP